jgi:hypothetical protein
VIPLNARHRYPAARRCIHCSNTGVAAETLGEEHIIPLSFGANRIIPLASCRSCERMTSAIEDHCVKGMISAARPRLGIRGRQSRKPSRWGRICVQQNNRLDRSFYI